MRAQKLCGIVLLVLTVIIILSAKVGTTPGTRDITGVLITLPLGIWMLVAKERVFS